MASDDEIIAQAVAYARGHRQRIARERTDPERYPREERPVSIFMAGSPGAGKTEISKEYVAAIDELRAEGFDGLGCILRIDLMTCVKSYRAIRVEILGCSRAQCLSW
ncbi:zeta toxin family protein [Halomonas sp. BC04]|uniref:zeta toxin family protein n=1 Tax=Halomonas sp. BC04 TaxID=1403540 RepID=UPI0003ED5E62|nr:zeta toxin family protein [Halomonas sp. BC04]EWH00772.1 hypothetical protein Q427_17585 [Halomonas sp. BC04]